MPVRDGQFLFEVEGRVSLSKAAGALVRGGKKLPVTTRILFTTKEDGDDI